MKPKGKRSLIRMFSALALAITIPQVFAWKRQKTYERQRKRALRLSSDTSVYCQRKRGDVFDITLRSPIDGFLLHTTLYPLSDPKGIVQMIHGIHEHRGRYEDFARFLQSHGYAVFVSDMRGHGHSVDHAFPRGYMGGYLKLRDDQYVISRYLKKRYPNTPLYLFGHSLGSLVARAYLQKYDASIDKLILSGTVMFYRPVRLGLPFLRFVDFYTRFTQWRLPSCHQKKKEEEILQKLDKDPDYLHGFKPKELMTVLELNQSLEVFSAYKRQNLDLPILSLSGEYDYLVTGGKMGVSRTMETLSRLGYKDMISIVYTDMKHEILKDARKEFVYLDILSLLEITKK